MRSLDHLDPGKLALVIIDLQHDYCAPQGLCAQKLGWDVAPLDAVCHAHEEFLRTVRGLLPAKRIIWFRMEEEAKTYAPNTAYGPEHADVFTPLCVRGTKGHDFHHVRPAHGERTFLKFHPSTFSAKPFRSFLEHEGITQLAYTGVLFSRCVNAGVIAGSALGYESLVLEDLTANPGNLAAEYAEHRKTTSLLYAPFVQSGVFTEKLKAALPPG